MSEPAKRVRNFSGVDGWTAQGEYNEHYDATAAKGLCWSGDGRPQAVSTVTLNGEPVEVECLWCVECQTEEGWIQEDSEGDN